MYGGSAKRASRRACSPSALQRSFAYQALISISAMACHICIKVSDGVATPVVETTG